MAAAFVRLLATNWRRLCRVHLQPRQNVIMKTTGALALLAADPPGFRVCELQISIAPLPPAIGAVDPQPVSRPRT